jgi:phosphatidylserine/phosphatidylglycerophosphate/cardiolipin synthase-like enzyme/peptidoglycan hydrolase-like protein with peptidoglycan-binding domain
MNAHDTDPAGASNMQQRELKFTRRRLLQGSGAIALRRVAASVGLATMAATDSPPMLAQAANPLRQRYTIAGTTFETHIGCTVQPFTSATAYFEDLARSLDQFRDGVAPESFVYLAGWLFEGGLRFGGAGTPTLLERLKDLSARGVDVRVLGWVLSPDIAALARTSLGSGLLPGWLNAVNGATMATIEALRTEPSLAAKACLNILGHPAGAAHLKLAIIGTGTSVTAYTGGIDLDTFRTNPTWFDVQAKVTGPAVDAMFDVFSELWNDLQSRAGVTCTKPGGGTLASHDPQAMPSLSNTLISAPGTGPALVQGGETLPVIRLGRFAPLASLLPNALPLASAPQGRFTIRPLWRKGVLAASTTIYMEDQSFTSVEVMDWANAALRANRRLRVVLVGAADDPTAPVDPAVAGGRASAINEHLLRDVPATDIPNRVAWFRPVAPAFVHSKSTIVDDTWAIVGSANCMRRSLYTDMEHAITMFEPNGSVAAYRQQLWGRYSGLSFPTGTSLAAATDTWFKVAVGATASIFKREQLPVAGVSLPLDVTTQGQLDLLQDVDSQTWTSPVPAPVRFELPLVKQPENSDRAKTLQYLLRAAGATITADGDFRGLTETAVSEFQGAAQLDIDGQVGQNTWLALIVPAQRGNAGDVVRALQNQLTSRGVPVGVDGDFGPDTESAVQVFQGTVRLPGTGIADLDTWLELLRP